MSQNEPVMSQRERFEAYARKERLDTHIEFGVYSSPFTFCAWKAWQAACPESYQCVPKEPTGEMLDRAWADCGVGGRQDYIEAYTAMLSAAPKPEDL